MDTQTYFLKYNSSDFEPLKFHCNIYAPSPTDTGFQVVALIYELSEFRVGDNQLAP